MKPIIQTVKTKFSELVNKHNLGSQRVQVTVKTLSPKQAIGSPGRNDFPILLGKEVIVEAQFDESFGQSFTDRPQSFNGTIDELLNLNLDSSSNRAIFIASLNAITAHLGIASGTRHCRDEEPEKCALQIAKDLKQRFGDIKIGLIGLQPAILQNLGQSFGAENVACTDLNPNNVGSRKFGIEIWSGAKDTDKLINQCDLILVTSSSLTNGTFDNINIAATAANKPIILFGITGAGICALTGLERICFYGH
ncbi:MAG: DUF364 domain-containing protein [Chloroflexota bacterium]